MTSRTQLDLVGRGVAAAERDGQQPRRLAAHDPAFAESLPTHEPETREPETSATR
ncbi:MAG: hypothetical protein FWJ93_15020 [Micromonosporaceae bacterium]